MVSRHTNIKSYKLCNLFYQFQIQIPTILRKLLNCKKWASHCTILVVLIILEILLQIYNFIHVIYLQKPLRNITIDAFILIISVMELYSILKKNYLQTKFWLATNFFCLFHQGIWLVLFMLFEVTIGKSSESMANFGKQIG